MAPRAYNPGLRLAKQAELKARIAAATAELHAEKGVVGTSYAAIAERAGVSLPTVYAHYPTQPELLAGCIAHVAGRAPALPVAHVHAATTLGEAAQRLTDAVLEQHAHFEPWHRWREDRVIAYLGERQGQVRDARAGLIADVLARHLGRRPSASLVAGWESLLSFDFWYRLTNGGHRISRSAARQTIVTGLVALASAPPPSASTPKSRRKP